MFLKKYIKLKIYLAYILVMLAIVFQGIYPSKIEAAETTQSNPSNNFSDVNDFIKILEDDQKRAIFIQSLKEAMNAPGAEASSSSSSSSSEPKAKENKALSVVNSIQNVSNFGDYINDDKQTTVEKIEQINKNVISTTKNILDYAYIFRYKDFFYSKYLVLKNDLQIIFQERLSDILSLILLLAISFSFIFVMEKIISRISCYDQSYKEPNLLFIDNSSLSMVYFWKFVINTLYISIPIFLPSIAILLLLVYAFDSYNLTKVIYLVLLFVGSRLVYLSLKLLLSRSSDKFKYKVNKYVNTYGFILFLVIIAHIILYYPDIQIFQQISLTIVILCSLFIFRKAQSIVVFLIKNRNHLDQESLNFITQTKKYLTTLYTFFILYLGMVLFFLDYSYTKDFAIYFFFSANGIVVFFIIQKVITYLFKKYIIRKIKDDLIYLSSKEAQFAYAYDLFSLDGYWKVTKYMGYILVFFVYVYFLDLLWNTKLMGMLKNFLVIHWVDVVLQIIMGLFFLMIITMMIIIATQYYIIIQSKKISHKNLHKKFTLFLLCKKPYKILVAIIFIINLASAVGVSLNTILASTGILTVIVALGAKDILNNFFSAIVFLMEDSLSINDFVQIGGVVGKVEDMTMVYIKLRDVEGRLHLVPFSAVEIVTNYNRDFAFALVDVGISYESDIDKAKKIIEQVVEEAKQDPELAGMILGDLDMTGVVALSDYSVNIRFKIKTTTQDKLRVRSKLFQMVKEQFSKEGIEIPYPHTVLLRKDSGN